jgi:NifU-like protein involved in Fe-S cluster formation
MDELVKEYYRDLLQVRFRNFGALVNPSVFVDSAGEQNFYCGSGNDFMQLFINISDNVISDIKYSCFCIPAANVAVEIICGLIKGKTIDEVRCINAGNVCQFLGSNDEEFRKKAKAILELLNIGLDRHNITQSST